MGKFERRLSRRLYSKWYEARKTPGLPVLADVENETIIDPELRDRSFVVDVTPGPGDYRFRRFGTALRQIAGADFTGYRVASLPASIADDALGLCHAAVESAKPVSRDEELVQLFGRPISYRLIVLPVIGQSDSVEALVGTVGFRPHNANGADWSHARELAA